jgi:hypothetical protein
MPSRYEVRADFDADSIVIYQAYSPAIAEAAVEAQRFVPPFSFGRMTWIKPSFLWLMHRSNWGQRPGQEHVLAVRITRKGWEEALALGVLTAFDRSIFASHADWQAQFEAAAVRVQWDPERSLRGGALPYDSIQVGLSRHIIRNYVEKWIVGVRDLTPAVRKMHQHLREGKAERARRLLPAERVYPVPAEIGRRLLIET